MSLKNTVAESNCSASTYDKKHSTFGLDDQKRYACAVYIASRIKTEFRSEIGVKISRVRLHLTDCRFDYNS